MATQPPPWAVWQCTGVSCARLVCTKIRQHWAGEEMPADIVVTLVIPADMWEFPCSVWKQQWELTLLSPRLSKMNPVQSSRSVLWSDTCSGAGQGCEAPVVVCREHRCDAVEMMGSRNCTRLVYVVQIQHCENTPTKHVHCFLSRAVCCDHHFCLIFFFFVFKLYLVFIFYLEGML